MLSNRNSSMNRRRMGSTRHSTTRSYTDTIKNTVSSVFLSNDLKKKKNDDFHESWMPSMNGLQSKSGKKHGQNVNSIVVMGILFMLGCGTLGYIAGFIRGTPVVDPIASISVGQSDEGDATRLLRLAKEGKLEEVHLGLELAIEKKCSSTLHKLSKKALENFQSHMYDVVIHISEGLKLSHVENPVVDETGGIHAATSVSDGYKCSLIDDFVQISSGNIIEDYEDEFGKGYEESEIEIKNMITGYPEHDSRILVQLASQHKIYEIEQMTKEAFSTQCDLHDMSDRAKHMFLVHMADILEKVATHHEILRGVEFQPLIDISDGAIVDGSDIPKDLVHKYRSCKLLTLTTRHALAPIEEGIKTLYDEIDSHDYYAVELQSKLLIEHHCANVKTELSADIFSDFQAHFIDFAYYLEAQGSVGDHSWVVTPKGGITTHDTAISNGFESSQLSKCSLLQKMAKLYGDNKNEIEKETIDRLSQYSDSHKEEMNYIKENEKKTLDPKHDATFLLNAAKKHDFSSLDKSIPKLLLAHCNDITKHVQQSVLDNMKAHIIGQLMYFAAGTNPVKVTKPAFNHVGSIVEQSTETKSCLLLSEIYEIGNKQSTTITKDTPKETTTTETQEEAEKVSKSETQSEKKTDSENKFLTLDIETQISKVLKEIKDNDWYDAELHTFDMFENSCANAMNKFITLNSKNDHKKISDIIIDAHANIMGILNLLAKSDTIPSGHVYFKPNGEIHVGDIIPSDGFTCDLLTKFHQYARTHVNKNPDARYHNIDFNAALSEQKGHSSHLDDISHDLNLLLEDAKSGRIIDLELDIREDLKTHCNNVLSKLKSRSQKKLHSKIVQIVENISKGSPRNIKDAVITNEGNIISRSDVKSSNDKIYECQFVSQLLQRS